VYERSAFSGTYCPVHPAFFGIDRCFGGASGGETMNPLYLIAGIIALGLLLYLVLALVKPEWFG
jgi:K+-transporting ATPase KdpF subunit